MAATSEDETNPLLPRAVPRSYSPFQLSGVGDWLVLSDLHVPYHERAAIEAAVDQGVKDRVCGVLLNGDILDSHELSTFDKDPDAPRYKAERKAALRLFGYLRHHFPRARIIYKSGNHEDRLASYLMRRAPALYNMKCTQFQEIMELDSFGIEYVGDKRVIRLGKLNIIHGHEYKPNIQAPVNPARGLFLRTKGSALCGHFHQTSEHHEPTINGKPQGCWSTGCLCQLSPQYMPLNKWNLGFAIVNVHKGGRFSVQNFRVRKGQVV